MNELLFIQPDLRPVAKVGGFLGFFKKDIFLNCADWEFDWEEEGIQYSYFIPKGVVTDIASVPRILWWLIPPDGDLRGAALIHDDLYHYQGKPPMGRVYKLDGDTWIEIKRVWTRNEADKFLSFIMGKAGALKTKRDAVYAGVLVGGWIAWRKKRKELITKTRIDYYLEQFRLRDEVIKDKVRA